MGARISILRWRGSLPISFKGNISSAFWNTDCTFLLVTFYMKCLNIRNVLTILTQIICLNYIHIKRYPCFSLPKKKCKKPTRASAHMYFFFCETIFCDIILLLFTSTQSAVYQYLAQGLNSELESFSCNI